MADTALEKFLGRGLSKDQVAGRLLLPDVLGPAALAQTTGFSSVNEASRPGSAQPAPCITAASQRLETLEDISSDPELCLGARQLKVHHSSLSPFAFSRGFRPDFSGIRLSSRTFPSQIES
jgi:hypothetical protein